MREFVRIGSPEEITAFREAWMARARQLADKLALPYTVDVANDPFFGRVGQIMAVSQLQQSLKFELLIPYYAGAKPTACMSFNYHREHFGHVWGLTDARDELAHTGCVAFGMDRLAVALFANHGADPAQWPAARARRWRCEPASAAALHARRLIDAARSAGPALPRHARRDESAERTLAQRRPSGAARSRTC